MRWRDAMLLVLGALAGYALAVVTRAGTPETLVPVRAYIATHTVEVFIGLILLGIILSLMGTGGRRK